MKQLSIGFRLSLWYLAIFAAAQFFFGVGMWYVLRQHLYGIADGALAEQVEDVGRLLKAQKEKNRTVPKLQEEVSEAYDLEHPGDFLQIYDQDGNWIFRAAALEKNPVAPIAPSAVGEPSFANIQLANQPYRFITQKVEANGRAFTVQTGIPINEMVATLAVFERYLLMLAPLLLLIAASVGYWLSRKALSPVDAIARTARTISGSNLTARLKKLKTGDELQRLSDTLNEMLERLESAFLRVTQFTADASHELRTPISLIRTEAEISLRASEGEEEYRDALRHILLESERTSLLIEDLLALARADSGRESLLLAPVELGALMTETANEWAHLIATRKLRFDREFVSDDLTALADQNAIRRLLTILLDNAVKYTPSPGRIGLRLESRAGRAVITVRDTGIGISKEDQTRIFERFFRVDKARSRDLGGSGLGLAIADWIVRRHGGSITVESSLGAGSIFNVELPLQPVEAPATKTPDIQLQSA